MLIRNGGLDLRNGEKILSLAPVIPSASRSTDVFRTKISIGAGGEPVIGWEPRLAPEEEAKRIYTIYGREKLDVGGWITPTNSRHRFFKVGVELLSAP